MNSMSFNTVVLAVGLAVFVAVLLLAEGAYLLWQQRFGREARRLQSRLEALAGSRRRAQAEVLRQREQAPGLVQGWLARLGVQSRLELLFRQAQIGWSPSLTLLSSLLAGLLTFFMLSALARQPAATALILGLGVGSLPWGYVLLRRRRRLGKLEKQLPDALDLMVRSLRAGHAFSSSLQMVAEEMDEPIASEFRAVHDEVNYGLNLPQAFDNLIERVPLTDLRYFVVAVLIQREAGGNLTELLANLSRLIRARLKFISRVRVISSEGRFSGWILVVLPFALGALFNAVNPEFMRPLWTDPIGISMLNWLLGMMAVGVLIMRKVVRIRV